MPEAELHAPDHFYLWPPNLAEYESSRIMRQGKTLGNATEVLVAKEVVGGGTRGERTGEAGLRVTGSVSGWVENRSIPTSRLMRTNSTSMRALAI